MTPSASHSDINHQAKALAASLLNLSASQQSELAEQTAKLVIDRIKPLLAESGPRLISRTELAPLVGLSESTIDRLVKANKIPSHAVGNRRLFDVRDVIDAIKGGAK